MSTSPNFPGSPVCYCRNPLFDDPPPVIEVDRVATEDPSRREGQEVSENSHGDRRGFEMSVGTVEGESFFRNIERPELHIMVPSSSVESTGIFSPGDGRIHVRRHETPVTPGMVSIVQRLMQPDFTNAISPRIRVNHGQPLTPGQVASLQQNVASRVVH